MRSSRNTWLLDPNMRPQTDSYSSKGKVKRIPLFLETPTTSGQRQLSFNKQIHIYLGSLTRTSSLFSKGKSLGLAHSN